MRTAFPLLALAALLAPGCLDGGSGGGARGIGEWSSGEHIDVRLDRVTAVPANATMAAGGGAYEVTIAFSVRWHNGSTEVSGFRVDAGGFGELARQWDPPALREPGEGQVTAHTHWSVPRHLPNEPLSITIEAAACGTKVEGGWQGSETVADCRHETARFRAEPMLLAGS